MNDEVSTDYRAMLFLLNRMCYEASSCPDFMSDWESRATLIVAQELLVRLGMTDEKPSLRFVSNETVREVERLTEQLDRL